MLEDEDEKDSSVKKIGLTCLRKSLVFLVILSIAEFSGSPFSFLPVCENKTNWHLIVITIQT